MDIKIFNAKVGKLMRPKLTICFLIAAILCAAPLAQAQSIDWKRKKFEQEFLEQTLNRIYVQVIATKNAKEGTNDRLIEEQLQLALLKHAGEIYDGLEAGRLVECEMKQYAKIAYTEKYYDAAFCGRVNVIDETASPCTGAFIYHNIILRNIENGDKDRFYVPVPKNTTGKPKFVDPKASVVVGYVDLEICSNDNEYLVTLKIQS